MVREVSVNSEIREIIGVSLFMLVLAFGYIAVYDVINWIFS